MSDTLTTITNLIQSPPGVLVAGAALAGIVWKFFERVEAVLTDQTKLEIAVWLLGVKVGPRLEPWPDTFAKVFDRVFGEKHLSWKCFWRSCVASLCMAAVSILVTFRRFPLSRFGFVIVLGIVLTMPFLNLVPDYISLFETRFTLRLIGRAGSGVIVMLLLLGDACFTACLAGTMTSIASHMRFQTFLEGYPYRLLWSIPRSLWLSLITNPFQGGVVSSWLTYRGGIYLPQVYFYPAFFTSIWLWLYAGSGFLLKAARRFDIGFDWFNRKFDIEKKPLQCIGLVAGALVAMVYWGVVVVNRVF